MPTVEFHCQSCGYSFRRVVLRGERVEAETCPGCRSAEAKPLSGGAPLFDGISPFSDLATSTD